VKTIDDFLELLNTEIGLRVSAEQAELSLDRVADWDSVHLLSVLTVLERTTGRPVSLADALEARSLSDIYALAVAA
jgi:acyl carrier protein